MTILQSSKYFSIFLPVILKKRKAARREGAPLEKGKNRDYFSSVAQNRTVALLSLKEEVAAS